jgi:DNA polymerase III delta prime subunit
MGEYEVIDDGDGMKVLRNVLDLESDKKGNVVIRPSDERFWHKVIEATEKSRVCAMGTPGIGKTTTTSILIRELLQQKKIVIYRVCGINNEGYIYLFTPKEFDGVNVNVIRENEFIYDDPVVNNEAIYYIVDPGKFNGNCDLHTAYKGKVIIVASPNCRHWGRNEFGKDRRGVRGKFLFFPIWSLYELITARFCFPVHLEVVDIEDRFETVGGIPRHIFTTMEVYNDVINKQKNAINKLNADQIRSMTNEDMSSVPTFDSSEPESAIMVYKPSDESFEKFTCDVSSKHIFRLLVKEKIIYLWNCLLDRGGAKGATTWEVFETYCQEIMSNHQEENTF